MKSRQLARFRVDAQAVRERPDEIAEVFSILRFVPVRAECLFATRQIEYVGISTRFSYVPDGMTVPEVNLTVNSGDDGHVESVCVVYSSGLTQTPIT